jgi:hypothetical protein
MPDSMGERAGSLSLPHSLHPSLCHSLTLSHPSPFHITYVHCMYPRSIQVR